MIYFNAFCALVSVLTGIFVVIDRVTAPKKRNAEWRKGIESELNIRDKRIKVLERDLVVKMERFKAQEQLNVVMLRALYTLIDERTASGDITPDLAEAKKVLKNTFYKKAGAAKAPTKSGFDDEEE